VECAQNSSFKAIWNLTLIKEVIAMILEGWFYTHQWRFSKW